MVSFPSWGKVKEPVVEQEGVICIMWPSLPISQMWKLRPKEGKGLTQGHPPQGHPGSSRTGPGTAIPLVFP